MPAITRLSDSILGEDLKTPIGEVTADHRLAQFYDAKSGKIELPNKLGAMQLLAKMYGWNEPEKHDFEHGYRRSKTWLKSSLDCVDGERHATISVSDRLDSATWKANEPMNLPALLQEIRAFRDERDWSQFHNAKDMAAAIAIEASELQELFLWKTVKRPPKESEPRLRKSYVDAPSHTSSSVQV